MAGVGIYLPLLNSETSMKRLIAILAGLVACTGMVCFAGDPAPSDAMTITTINQGTYTQAVDSVTNGIYTSGWIEGIWVTFTGGGTTPAPTATVSVVAIHDRTDIYDFTILPATVQGETSKWYAVRSPVQNQAGVAIANTAGRLPLNGNKFVFKAYSANNTGTAFNATAYVITSR